MVSQESVEKQLKKIKFNVHGWGRTEAHELKNILLEGEEIYEVINGIYEGGFAMLIATDVRLLLVDKKPMNYLTVEDMRFDMINELDYNHRLLGAHISISAGTKNLKFTSYNQPRLRKLIGHVQHCMADAKRQQSSHQVDQKQHLEQINQQLQTYLLAQHQQQQKLHDQLVQNNKDDDAKEQIPQPEVVRPSNELSDYLFAQSLLAQYKAANGELSLPDVESLNLVTPDASALESESVPLPAAPPTAPTPTTTLTHTVTENRSNPQMSELYAEGMQEIFGKRDKSAAPPTAPQQVTIPAPTQQAPTHNPGELNALKIAYSKLPMALRNRRFGRPSFHSHSQQEPNVTVRPLREM
ncbi:MAG: hypothetical protein JWO35_457 [Candidatus Saccharibacteria bacterium]|nr:hypothetical protein [Candidatus Saccharibacteria bacterium]